MYHPGAYSTFVLIELRIDFRFSISEPEAGFKITPNLKQMHPDIIIIRLSFKQQEYIDTIFTVMHSRKCITGDIQKSEPGCVISVFSRFRQFL